MSHSYTELEQAEAEYRAEAERLRKELDKALDRQLEYANRAIANGEQAEVERERHAAEVKRLRKELDAAREDVAACAEQAEGASADVLRIVSDWCIEANEVGGVDAGDLAWRLEQAGYPFADPH